MASAARAERVGLQHYRASTAGATINRVEMAAALEAFETQCREGDWRGLERRAYALNALGRTVEAAETLDVYLSRRPLHTFEAAQRTQLATQQAAILATVGTVQIDCSIAGATVLVNGRSYGALPRGPIRIAAGELSIQVIIPAAAPLERTLRIAPGEVRRETFGPRGSTAATTNTSTTVSTQNTTSAITASTRPNTTAPPIPTATGSTAGITPSVSGQSSSSDPVEPIQEPPIVAPPGPRATPVLAIGFGAGAGAAGILLLTASLWRGNRIGEYTANCTGASNDPPECATVAGERSSAETLQIVSGIAMGALVVATGVALGLWLATPPRARPNAQLILTPGRTDSSAAVLWRF